MKARKVKSRKREWYLLGVCWAIALMLFSTFPQLDLIISRWAQYPTFSAEAVAFPLGQWPLIRAMWWTVPLIGQTIFVLGVVGMLLLRYAPAISKRFGLARYKTRMLALWLLVFLGLGLSINWGLKEFWGRPRPVTVQELGGVYPFQKIHEISHYCRSNCSFVSGHAGTGFALLGWGLMATPAVRRRWWRVGMSAGLLFGLGRIVQGGHFVSDIVFAGLVIWLVGAVIRSAWLRLRWLRLRWHGSKLLDFK
jgi:membrane-associated PAP2 superfamily phosphatase